jgi:GntR family transcriptional regulator
MARFQLQLGPVPLHHQVYTDLRSALDAGDWRPGDRLPPERELAARYGVSIITVRHALGELAREGRIERTRGRGTHVLRPLIDRDLAGGLSFAEEMERRGLAPRTRVVDSRIEPAGQAVAQSLEIGLGAPTVYLERLRLAGGDPLLLEQVHLSETRFPGLLGFDFEQNSLYDLLTEHYGIRIARAKEAFEPVLLRAREARLLGLKPRAPALLVEGVAFTVEGEPIEAARTYVRGDRSRYYVERSVARSSWQQRWEEPQMLAAGLRPRSGLRVAASAGGEEGANR